MKFYYKVGLLFFGWVFFGAIIYSRIYTRPAKKILNEAKDVTWGNPLSAPRIKIIYLNSMTILFLFMSISEFKFYEYMNPIGIDSDAINSKCQFSLRFSLSLYVIIAIIFFYNFYIVWGQKYVTDIMAITPSELNNMSTTDNNIKNEINKCFNTNKYIPILESIGIVTVRAILPHSIEVVFGCFMCFASLGIYTTFLALNYFGKGSPLKECIHTQESNQYIDIYNESQPLPQSY